MLDLLYRIKDTWDLDKELELIQQSVPREDDALLSIDRQIMLFDSLIKFLGIVRYAHPDVSLQEDALERQMTLVHQRDVWWQDWERNQMVTSWEHGDKRWIDRYGTLAAKAGAELAQPEQDRIRELRSQLVELSTQFNQKRSELRLNPSNAMIVSTKQLHQAGLEGMDYFDYYFPPLGEHEDEHLAPDGSINRRLFPDDNTYSIIQRSCPSSDFRKKVAIARSQALPENGVVIQQIRVLRQKLAELMGFRDWAAYQMAGCVLTRSTSILERELQRLTVNLQHKAYKMLEDPKLTAITGSQKPAIWDIVYLAEQLVQDKVFSEGTPKITLRALVDTVLQVVVELFNLRHTKLEYTSLWGRKMLISYISDATTSTYFGLLVFDLLSTPGKKQNTGVYTIKHPVEGADLSIAYVFGSLAQDWDHHVHQAYVSLLPHEVGHGLDELMNRQRYALLRQVPDDLKELPSMILERTMTSAYPLRLMTDLDEVGAEQFSAQYNEGQTLYYLAHMVNVWFCYWACLKSHSHKSLDQIYLEAYQKVWGDMVDTQILPIQYRHLHQFVREDYGALYGMYVFGWYQAQLINRGEWADVQSRLALMGQLLLRRETDLHPREALAEVTR